MYKDTLKTRPKSVAIVAMGSSRVAFENDILGGKVTVDEVWACNAIAGMLDESHYDKIFAMDDMRRHEYKGCMVHLKDKNTPLITSTAYDEAPNSVAYPLREILTTMGMPVFPDTTSAFALVYAIYIGAKEIKLYGTDFVVPGMPEEQQDSLASQDLEIAIRGKQTLNFWIGLAMGRGIKISLANDSGVLTTPSNLRHGFGTETLYGYREDFNLPAFMASLSENTNVS